jgi:preprotein translocase subunit SecF
MKHRKIWIIIAGVVLIVAGVLGVVFVRQNWNSKDTGPHSIEITFGFDEFTFMKHTLSEGDRMSAIMMENNIGMANSVNDTRDYFVYYADNMKAQVQVDESLTVSHISLAYDPDRTTTSSDLADMGF